MDSREEIKQIQAQLKDSPQDTELLLKLASLFFEQEKHDEANSLFLDILKKEPSNQVAIWNLARIAWQKKDYENSKSYMTKLSEISNKNLTKEQSLLFSKVFTHLGKFKEATFWLDSAISKDSSVLQSEIDLVRFLRHNLYLNGAYKKLQEKKYNNKNITRNSSPAEIMAEARHYIIIEMSHPVKLLGIPMPFLPSFSGQPQNFELDELDELNENEELEEDSKESKKEDLDSSNKEEDFENNINIYKEEFIGQEKSKIQVFKELVFPLSSGNINISNGISFAPRVFLYGPPACGKSKLCRVLAQETSLNFLGLYPSDFLDLDFEEAEAKLGVIFEKAKINSPSVIVLDDAEWLLSQESNSNNINNSDLFKRNILGFLVSLIKDPANNKVGLLGVTNKPWLCSPELLNKTFNKKIFFPAPSFSDKIEIFEFLLKKKINNLELDLSKINSFKIISALDKTCQCGADIENLINKFHDEINFERSFYSEIKIPEIKNLDEIFVRLGKSQASSFDFNLLKKFKNIKI